MFNFNNKKKIYQPTSYAHNQHYNNIQSIQSNNSTFDEIQANNSYDQEDNKQQQQATQFLLLISDLDMEMQNRNSTNKKYIKPEIASKGMEMQVEVAPWVNTPYRVNKQRNGYKSKTSIIGSICHPQKSICRLAKNLNHTQIKQNKKLSNTKIFNKQKQNSVEDMQHEGQPTTNHTNNLNQHNQSNKYKYKQQQHDQSQQYPSQQQQYQQNKTKIYHKYSCNKQNIQSSKTRNRYKPYRKLTCQNQNISVDEIMFDKKKNRSQKCRLKLQSNSCKKYGALAENSSIVNVQHRTCQYSQFYLKMSKNNMNNNNNNYRVDKQNEYTKQLQRQIKQQSTFRQSQFQHILSQIPKKCTESDQIKYKILQNIRKQSLIKANTPQSQQVQTLKSNKILGRYFKISQQNNSKYKIKKNMNIFINTIMAGLHKNQSTGERKYQQSNNNKTKYLYDKYRLILSKGK